MRTVGVEEELLLVDPDSGEPKALSAAVLAHAAQDVPGQDVFEKELFGQMLEFATHPQSEMAELGAEIVRCRKEAARYAGEIGCAVAALASSPLPVSPSINVNERYQWMAEQYGIATQEQLVCGCHVHVSVESDEEGVAVIDRLRPWLAVLCALSANSPFWQGHDTGYAAYRSRVWGRWPSAGPTELFGSAERYHRRVTDMVATGVILDEAMAYFDARLSARYPTVEIRVADVCLRADTAVLVATLARALVETAAHEWRAGKSLLDHGVSLLRLASWQAARSGLDQDLLDPASMRPRPAADVVHALLEHIGDALTESGDAARAEGAVAELLSWGNGAREQRLLKERTGSLRAVVAECVRHTQR
ncbi:glutamate--cysteine ligase [Streptomyces sp. NPDC101151]|uniref:glutamate--cysteine ligase 2 n=1 Tax=Streptomyces sp. NPDC101151 TaxID=3366115 RepID=UPI0037F4EBA4